MDVNVECRILTKEWKDVVKVTFNADRPDIMKNNDFIKDSLVFALAGEFLHPDESCKSFGDNFNNCMYYYLISLQDNEHEEIIKHTTEASKLLEALEEDFNVYININENT